MPDQHKTNRKYYRHVKHNTKRKKLDILAYAYIAKRHFLILI